MRVTTRVITGISALALVAACAKDNQGSAGATTGAQSASSGVDLTGAGATFPQPIYNKWFSDYATKTGVKINYQSIGSGGGVRQIMEQTVDFGATDGPMKDDELAKAKGGSVMHFPTVLGAVVIAYNVPELTQPLKLTGPAIADIFLGKITKWNDPRIAALNPGVKLPANDILVVHRSDGSGTTFVFTDYLAAVSPEWSRVVGRNKEVKWPAGIGAKATKALPDRSNRLQAPSGTPSSRTSSRISSSTRSFATLPASSSNRRSLPSRRRLKGPSCLRIPTIASRS